MITHYLIVNVTGLSHVTTILQAGSNSAGQAKTNGSPHRRHRLVSIRHWRNLLHAYSYHAFFSKPLR